MTHYLSNLWQKVVEMAGHPAGWLTGLLLFVADAVSGGALIIYLVVVATVIDLICGIAVSVKRKNFTKSELMRLTVEKLVVYGAALLVFLCIDKAIEEKTDFEFALTSGVVGVVITMTEAWSFLASMLILFPKNPFLRLLQKALVGEIARKLQCEEEAVEAILKEARRKKDMPTRNAKGQFVKKQPKKRAKK